MTKQKKDYSFKKIYLKIHLFKAIVRLQDLLAISTVTIKINLI